MADVVHRLVGGARDALGDRFVGGYLVGSFALGAGDEWSDLDFVVVTDDRPDDDVVARLRDLHGTLPDVGGPWATHLEGSYAVAADLASPVAVGRRWWYVDHGSREPALSAHDNANHTRWVLREHGVTVAGPDPASLVAVVTPEALRAEALGAARARAEAGEDDPSVYGDAWSQPHSVLTGCRTLVTAAEAQVVSKAAAGYWALHRVDPRFRPLVERALAERPHPWERVGRPADPGLVAPTRDFAWEVVRLSGEAALEAREG